jgi:hypothetical protein
VQALNQKVDAQSASLGAARAEWRTNHGSDGAGQAIDRRTCDGAALGVEMRGARREIDGMREDLRTDRRAAVAAREAFDGAHAALRGRVANLEEASRGR